MRQAINIKTSNAFGAWLKGYCNRHKIRVCDLSRVLGVGRRHITHWIQGTSHPRLVNGVFLIDALSKITGEDGVSIYVDMRDHVKKDF